MHASSCCCCACHNAIFAAYDYLPHISLHPAHSTLPHSSSIPMPEGKVDSTSPFHLGRSDSGSAQAASGDVCPNLVVQVTERLRRLPSSPSPSPQYHQPTLADEDEFDRLSSSSDSSDSSHNLSSLTSPSANLEDEDEKEPPACLTPPFAALVTCKGSHAVEGVGGCHNPSCYGIDFCVPSCQGCPDRDQVAHIFSSSVQCVCMYV